jgi:hypothetical protein
MAQRMNSHLITSEENETTIVINYHSASFDCYTTNAKTARMFEQRLPDYYSESDDGASAYLSEVPTSLITKLKLSYLR